MATPQIGPEQIAWISAAVADHIKGQRLRYLPRAVPISAQQRNAMSRFFAAEVLATRVLTLHNERVDNPDFYSDLVALGFRNLPDQATMGAITFSDIVVSQLPFDNGLLFHEFVHVEQYRQLGIERFSELYVRGFLSGGGYDGIPLETQAYALGAQYESRPRDTFSVEEAVRESILSHAYG